MNRASLESRLDALEASLVSCDIKTRQSMDKIFHIKLRGHDATVLIEYVSFLQERSNVFFKARAAVILQLFPG
jgi:hypothetical protein